MTNEYKTFLMGKISEYFENQFDIEDDTDSSLSRQSTIKLEHKQVEKEKEPETQINENYSNLRYKIDFKKESVKQRVEDYFNRIVDKCNKTEEVSLKDLTIRAKSDPQFVKKLINLPLIFENQIDKINFNVDFEQVFGRVEMEVKFQKAPNFDLVRQKQTLNGHKFNILSIKQFKNKIISSAVDLVIKIWDFKSNSLILEREIEVNVSSLKAFDVFESELIVGCKDSKIMVYNIKTGDLINEINGSKSPITSLLALNAETIVTGHEDGVIKLWNMDMKDNIMNLSGHTKSVLCLKRLNLGQVLSGSLDKCIKLWDVITGNCLKSYESHSYAVYCIETLDETRFVSCSWDKTIKIWDKDHEECIRTLEGHKGPVRWIEVFENEDIVSCSDDGSLKYWKDGKCTHTLAVNSGAINCFTCLQSGEILIGCMNGSIKIWK